MAIELSKSTRSEKADTKTTLQVYMYVQALYASGLGNPGGMITALNLKQGGR